MSHKPSPDKDLIDQVLFDRLVNNMIHPIPEHESSLLGASPSNNDKSVGRLNNSFSRTKIASSQSDTEKAIMDDAKRKLFEEELEEEEEFLVAKQNTLMQQLLEQQHELKRLENKQLELVNLKKQAEARLAAANKVASMSLDGKDERNTPQKMHSKYNGNEIPYQIENVSDGNLVSYESSEDEDDKDEVEPLTLDSFQFDALQAKLAELNKRQKNLEEKSIRNQNIANSSFQNSNTDQNVAAQIEDEDNKEVEEGSFAATGHANTADYDQLCAKVEELRDRKKYMDQLLSYYNLLRESNNESKDMIEDDEVLKQSSEKFGDPSQRDQDLMKRINSFEAKSKPSQTSPICPKNASTQSNATANRDVSNQHRVTFSDPYNESSEKDLAPLQGKRAAWEEEGVEEIVTPGVQETRARATQEIMERKKMENEIRRDKQREEEKMEDIQSMRDQLARIQQEMSSITFSDSDSAENITEKLQGLESTRNRVKELRERLSRFEESDEVVNIPNLSGSTEEEKLQALLRAREKLQSLHDLAAKVKEARATGQGIPAELLNEISMIAPKESPSKSVDEKIEEIEVEEQDTSADEKLSALLRRKMELETIQNELKHLRDQQQLLSQMEQENQSKPPARAVPESDREHLWESLREKQAAQLDRLRRSESKYEGDSNDGYTTRATWGGSSIRSLETDQAVGDDIEGGTYPEKTFEDDTENGDEDEDGDENDLGEESRDARLLYEIETNYWIDHCKQLSKQLAERTHTIHMLLGDKSGKSEGVYTEGSRAELLSRIEHLTVENDALHSELNEIYGMDAFQHTPRDTNMKRRADETEFSTPGSARNRSIYSPYSASSTPYSAKTRQFRKPTTPSAFPQGGPPHFPPYYHPYNPRYMMPYFPPPPPPHFYPPYYQPFPGDYSGYSEEYSFDGGYPDYTSYNQSYLDQSVRSDGKKEQSEGTQTDKKAQGTDKATSATEGNNKNGKNVSFSLSQIRTSGDTISTQYPTPRKHEAYQKLADSCCDKEPHPTTTTTSYPDEDDHASSSSSASLQIVEESDYKEDEGETKEKTPFETLQNTVYSEVASLISANETRPHYLVELVKELAELDNDYLRQRHLFMLKDLRKSYISSDKDGDEQTGKQPLPTSSWLKDTNWSLLSASEATPSNNSVASDVENPAGKLSWDYVQSTGTKIEDAEYDYLENVENLSSVSTNNSHPFASESLGSTAINLSTDLADVRMREEMEKRLEEVVQDVIAKYGIRRSESSSAADNTSECEEASEIESSFSILEQEVKRVMIQVIPILRDNLSEVLTTPLELNIASTVIRTTASVFDNDQISENFASNLTNALKKYEGQTVQDAAHSIIVDLSEVLFSDVHSSHMIVDEDSEDMSEDNDEDEELGEMVLENGPTPTPQDIRTRFLESTGVGFDESDDPELEYSDATGNEVQCAVNTTQEELEEGEIPLSVVEGTPLQHRFSETGELFSDVDDQFSDVVELPPTTTEEESGDDEVPVRERSDDNILTMSDLPTKLDVPQSTSNADVTGCKPSSYRDAVIGNTKPQSPTKEQTPEPSTESPTRNNVSETRNDEVEQDRNSKSSEEGKDNAAAALPVTQNITQPGQTEGIQAALEIIGESKLVGDDSAIITPP